LGFHDEGAHWFKGNSHSVSQFYGEVDDQEPHNTVERKTMARLSNK
jgi:hypothetical protein